ncbi:MAG: PorP/SprF family type IX secretion system membrane protein [Bacteroidales bacterium]|nr:PorP/SprF family type IX secretion system membrane protein [Bacteroidales bacterium]
MKKLITLIIVIFAVFFSATESYSQDAHLSQYDASPVLLSPAFTGMFTDAEYHMAAQFRNQWGALGSKYTTTSMAYDMPIDEKWGVGGYILDDDAAKYFNSFSFIASGAYLVTAPGYSKYKLTVGMNLGFVYKSTKTDFMTFDNQWSDGNFDPDLPSGEAFEKNHILMPEVSIGFNYTATDNEKDVNPYAGLAVYHCTNPKESFMNNAESRLPIKFVFHGGAIIETSEVLKIDPKFLIMRQRNAMEITPGVRFHYLMEQQKITILAGTHYRIKDAFIFEAGLEYRNFTYKISYDFNTSELRPYSHGKGGLEFSVLFRGNKSLASSLL